jgi:hypothetical protein
VLDRLLARLDRPLQHVREQRVLLLRRPVRPYARDRHVRQLGGDPRGHLAHDGEHRALGRGSHRRVRALGGVGHRCADEHRVDELAGAGDQLLRGAAEELAEDHAAVPARPEQRGPRDGLDDLVAPDLVEQPALAVGEPVELVEHGTQRQGHVVPGVAVRDREHVEVVYLLAPRLEMRERPLDDRAEADETWIGHGEARRDR